MVILGNFQVWYIKILSDRNFKSKASRTYTDIEGIRGQKIFMTSLYHKFVSFTHLLILIIYPHKKSRPNEASSEMNVRLLAELFRSFILMIPTLYFVSH